MSQRFETLDPGRKYRLSDGTVLTFLTRNTDGVAGLSVEEVLEVLVSRLEALRRMNPNGRSISLAITDLQSGENWLIRWNEERRAERARSILKIEETRGIKIAEMAQ